MKKREPDALVVQEVHTAGLARCLQPVQCCVKLSSARCPQILMHCCLYKYSA